MVQKEGSEGAGIDDTGDLSSLKWMNKIRVRGATALQISESEAKKDPKLLKECFRHSVNRQYFADSLKIKIDERISAICPLKCQRDALCSSCSTAARKMFDEESTSSIVWDSPGEGIDWTGVGFPTSLEDVEVFSQNNPEICISVYRAGEDKGDVYLFYRSKLGEISRSEQKMIHIVCVTRLNTKLMELEQHFLPVTDLDAFCGLIYEYDKKHGNIKTQYKQGE